jgi:hypothetical protein
MMNHINIHHIIHRETIGVNQYSSTDSGIRCKKASHNKIPTENAIKHTNTFLSFANGYHIAKTQINDIALTISTAKIQYK